MGWSRGLMRGVDGVVLRFGHNALLESAWLGQFINEASFHCDLLLLLIYIYGLIDLMH